MHARELVEVAGMVARHGPLLACGARVPASDCLEQYWSASKARCESWGRSLKAGAVLICRDSSDPDRWTAIRAALDEIFTSEMLTRVWTAVLVSCDRRAGSNTAEPIARNVLATHLEARHRAM